MPKKNKQNQNEQAKAAQQKEALENEAMNEEQQTKQKAEEEVDPEKKIADLEAAVEHEKKEYMFLMSDFETFRRRTVKEKAELIKNGTESAMRDLLPVVDDMERALDAINKGGDLESLKEGVELIYNKLMHTLEQKGLQKISPKNEPFDTDFHEAIAMIPAPSEDLKGKVLDCAIDGYKLNDKVLRHAKVVVGS